MSSTGGSAAASTLDAIAPVLLVEDVRRSAAFYRERLGFETGQFFGEPPTFVIVSRGRAKIALRAAGGARPESNTRRVRESLDAYVWVSDVEALYREFKFNGAAATPPEMRPHGVKEIIIRDLDGYVLYFGQIV